MTRVRPKSLRELCLARPASEMRLTGGPETLVQLIHEHLAPWGERTRGRGELRLPVPLPPEIAQGSLDRAAAGRIAATCRARHPLIPLLNAWASVLG